MPWQNESTPASRWVTLGIPAAIVIVTFAAFVSALSNGFVDFDDTIILIQNPHFRGVEPENLRWMFTTTLMGHYQPLTWLSFAIDFQLSGGELDPFAFHLTNILLHSVSAALFYFVAIRLLKAAGSMEGGPSHRGIWVRTTAAVIAALFWSIHPLRVESVAWATERRDVLSGLFWLAALWTYLVAFPAGTQSPRSARWFALSVVFLVLSLLSKAWGMTFFVVAVILDWYPLRRLPESPLRWLSREARPVLAQKVPYAVLGVIFAAVAAYAQGSVQATREAAEWPIWARFVQAAYGLVWYPWTTLWPANLSALYELPIGLSPWEPRFLVCYAVLGVGAVALLVFRRRVPALLSAAAVYAVLVGPVLGLLQSGDQFVADRYSYLSCMSWSLLLGAGLVWLVRGTPRPMIVSAAVAAPILLVLGAVTFRLNHVWESSEALWKHAASGGPDRVMPRVNYGVNLQARAERLEGEGKTAEAAALLDEAIRNYQEAAKYRPIDGRPWYPLANALRKKGDFGGAERAYREAAKYMPQSYMPLVNLATMLEADPARRDEALRAFKEAAESVDHPRPGSKPAGTPFLALGLALKNRGDIPGATAAFQRARDIAIQTNDVECQKQAEGRLAQIAGGK